MLAIRLAERGFGLISIAVLARILSPADFGLVAVASTAYGILSSSLSFQFDNALIQKSDIGNDHLNSAWTLNVLRGIILSFVLLGLALSSPFLFEDIRIQSILFVLALLPFVEGFNNIGIVYFSKNIEFDKLFNFQITVKAISFAVTITTALYLRSYWALIAGMLATTITGVILSYAFHHYRPRFSLKHWKELFEFSIWLMASNFINALSSRFDVFIINKWMGSSVVGSYHIGQEVGTMVYSQIILPLSRSLFPGFSAIKDDKEKHKRIYLKSREALIMLGLPFGVGMASVSESFTAVVLGPGWEVAATILAFVSIASIIHVFTIGLNDALLSIAKTKTLFYRQLIASFVRPIFLIGGLFYWGLLGLLIGRILAAATMLFINLHLSSRAFSVSIFDHFLLVWRSIISVALMAGAIFVWKKYSLDFVAVNLNILELFIEVSIGAAVYCTSHFLLWIISGKPDAAETLVLEIMSKTMRKMKGPAAD